MPETMTEATIASSLAVLMCALKEADTADLAKLNDSENAKAIAKRMVETCHRNKD